MPWPGIGLHITQFERGADIAHAAILELHLGVDHAALLAGIQRLDQHAITLGNEFGAPCGCGSARRRRRPASLCKIKKRLICEWPRRGSRARSALIFPRIRGSARYTGPAGQVGVAGVGQIAFFRPVAHRREVNIDERRGVVAAIAKKVTASLIYGKNFSLFSRYFGANMPPWVNLPTSLAGR